MSRIYSLKAKAGRRAFSLVEILIAFGILAACVLPVITMLQSGQKKSAFNEFYLFGHIRAMRMLERLSSYPYEAIVTSCNNTDGMVDVIPEEYLNRIQMEDFKEECVVDTFDVPDGLYRLTAIVHWKVPGSMDMRKSYQISRLMRKKRQALLSDYSLE